MRHVGGTVTPDQTSVQIERMNARWERDGFGSLLAERRVQSTLFGLCDLWVHPGGSA